MDRTYRDQRLIYDITRRHFLLGRDHLLRDLSPPQGGHILDRLRHWTEPRTAQKDGTSHGSENCI